MRKRLAPYLAVVGPRNYLFHLGLVFWRIILLSYPKPPGVLEDNFWAMCPRWPLGPGWPGKGSH